MGLKELLAAKKAAAAKESEEVEKELPKEAEEKKAVSAISNLAAMGLDSIEESKEETVMNSVPAGRKETFSEMMARKKREKEASNSSTIVSEDGKVDAPVVIKEIPKVELSDEQKEVLNEIEDDTEAQAYTDIALKINSLKYSATGDDLTKAMNTLTAALHKNPSASMLLLDPDIGQMTLAIRRLVGDELEEAKSGKKEKKTKAAKQIELTPERLSKQFDIPDDM